MLIGVLQVSVYMLVSMFYLNRSAAKRSFLISVFYLLVDVPISVCWSQCFMWYECRIIQYPCWFQSSISVWVLPISVCWPQCSISEGFILMLCLGRTAENLCSISVEALPNSVSWSQRSSAAILSIHVDFSILSRYGWCQSRSTDPRVTLIGVCHS